MNIFIVTNTRPHLGGITTYINALSEVLRTNDHKVRVISSLGAYDKERKVMGKSNKFLTFFLEKGNPIVIFLLYSVSKKLLLFFFVKEYLKIKPDIIHAADVTATRAVTVFARKRKIPIVTSIHSFVIRDLVGKNFLKQDSFLKKYFLNEEKKAGQDSDKLTVSCANVEKYVKEIDFGDKAVRIPNFVDVGKFYPDENLKLETREKYDYNKDDFILLYIGRMIIRKGPIYPARVLKQLLAENKSVKLIYIGDGPEQDNVLKYVQENNLEEFVRFMGPRPHSELNKFHNLADVIIFPFFSYKGDVEPAGISPLEASASGIPMVSFNSGGLKESVIEGYNGFLVKEHDLESLAEKVKLLYNNKEKLKEMSSNSRDFILEKHDQNVVYKKIINLYEQVIKS